MIVSDLTGLVIKVKYLNRWLIFLVDLFLSIFSTAVALTLISSVQGVDFVVGILIRIILISTTCSIISFFTCQTYKVVIRHSTFTETGRIAMASLLKIAMVIPALPLFLPELSYKELLLGSVIDMFLTFFVLTVVRALMIMGYRIIINNLSPDRAKLLIYEGHNNDVSLLRQSLSDRSGTYQIEGSFRIGNGNTLRIGGYPPAFGYKEGKRNGVGRDCR